MVIMIVGENDRTHQGLGRLDHRNLSLQQS